MTSQTLSLIIEPLTARVGYFTRPERILRGYKLRNLRFDIIAGITVGVILLPQALVFSVMAGLPPQMGLYTAVVASIVGALWGSSNQLHTGPTNTSALLVLSTVLPIAALGSPQYILAAGLLTVMAGAARLIFGLLRLGMLVNFVSDSVIVGFTAGAGILIIVTQMRTLLRLDFADTPRITQTLANLAAHISETHLLSLALGLGTIALLLLLQHLWPRLPAALIVVTIAGGLVALLDLQSMGIVTIGNVHGGLPPIARLPLFNLELIGDLSFGALAIAAIGLVEASSIARSLATQTGQRLDSNQEFVGQGLANIAAGIFSGYAASGSFNRSVANYQAGAKTSVAAASAGIFVLITSTLFASLIAYVPRATLAGLLIFYAFAMINRREIARIWRSSRGEAVILSATLAGTLLLPLQFAVLMGILVSLAFYLLQTSAPQVLNVLPDERFRHFTPQENRSQCPQLAVVEVRGDLYFGAVSHVEERILQNQTRYPGQQYLLLRMQNVQQVDISGIHMLESLIRTYRDRGGDVYMVKVRDAVEELMRSTGLFNLLGEDHILDEDAAISHIFHHVLDPGICIYECETRAFFECQNLPRPTYPIDLAVPRAHTIADVPIVAPRALYGEMQQPAPPHVIDVREPREFRRAHIPRAENIPLPRILANQAILPIDQPIVLACRTGRRSRGAAAHLIAQGHDDVRQLDGGMVAWEAAGLLEAIDTFDWNEGIEQTPPRPAGI